MTNCKFCGRAAHGETLCPPCSVEAQAFLARIMPTPAEESLLDSYAIGALVLGLVFAGVGAFIWLHRAGALAWPI